MILTILYWVILVLAIVGTFAPPATWPNAPRFANITLIALLIIIGLRDFRTPLT